MHELQNSNLADSSPSRIVLGGGSFLDISHRDLEVLLLGAQEMGISRIDTSPCYGNSEKKIGEVLSGSQNVQVMTKVCLNDSGELTKAQVMSSVEKSLKELKQVRLDSLLLHEVNLDQILPEALEALVELKTEGVVGSIGVSSDNEYLLEYQSLGIFDRFMATLNVVDQSNLEVLRTIVKNPTHRIVTKRSLANGVWRRDFRYRILEYYKGLRKDIGALKSDSYTARHRLISEGSIYNLNREAYANYAFSWDLRSDVLVGTRSISHLKQIRDVENSSRMMKELVDAFEISWRLHSNSSWRAHT